MCAVSNSLCREWKLKRRTWRHQCNQLHFFNGNNLKYAVIFAQKGKSNTSFGTVKGLLLFVCTHNINKTLCFYKITKTNMMRFLPSRLEQERFTKMNRKSVNTCLTDMINISIERFKLLINKINQIENKNPFTIIIIREDALLSKGVSNEEMASQDHHLHLCDTDTENTSLLVNNSNISLLFPPDTFMVITFAGALRQALLRVFECRTLQLRWRHACMRDTKHRRAALDSRGSTVSCCFQQRGNFFSSLIDACLKYKNKEKP